MTKQHEATLAMRGDAGTCATRVRWRDDVRMWVAYVTNTRGLTGATRHLLPAPGPGEPGSVQDVALRGLCVFTRLEHLPPRVLTLGGGPSFPKASAPTH